jgi:uncharacterized RDD family membrane protein YckC
MSPDLPPPTTAAAELAWQRFWARQFDNAICWGIATGIAALLGMSMAVRGRNVLVAIAIGAVLVGVLQLIYEVLLVTLFGTTIGKSVFGLRIETQYGKRAEFARVVGRSASVWLRGSYAYVLFPVATLYAWKKSHDELRLKGLSYWDEHSETEVAGSVLPLWHVSTGAALAIAGFCMVLLWQTTGSGGGNATLVRAGGPPKSIAAGTIQPPSSPTSAAPAPQVSPPSQVSPASSAAAEASGTATVRIRNGSAVMLANDARKSFAITAPPARPSSSRSVEELALWAERTYPYFLADGAERRAMFAWMVAGTRVGLPRNAALALGIDTVVSGRENARGVCWPVMLAPDRIANDVAGNPDKGVLGIRCER